MKIITIDKIWRNGIPIYTVGHRDYTAEYGIRRVWFNPYEDAKEHQNIMEKTYNLTEV